MTSFIEPHTFPPLDLDILEADSAPAFVIKAGPTALDFELIFCNEALRTSKDCRDAILSQNRDGLLFRSWSLALGDFDPTHEFLDKTWSAYRAGATGGWKVVKALEVGPKEQDLKFNSESTQAIREEAPPGTHRAIQSQPNQTLVDRTRRESISFPDMVRVNLHARWDSVQTMMEMSDVGVFEYNTQGKLLHANEAWYRLSSHPKDLPTHVQFSFMDLVYEEDQALVMSMWNKLSLGNPVTFEMRWKPRPGSKDTAQWVLSACVPVFDDEGALIRIAGNTIDINGQKKSQEAAQARVEALEQARLSELKFARFAQLSPTAIYIFVPNSGMTFVNDQFFELTGCTHAPKDASEWFDIIADEDVDRAKEDWVSMLNGNRSQGFQFRLKKQWTNQDGICSNIWVQSSSYPELDESGNVISIMGTLFDISQFQWADSVQRRRIEEALEAKRQQENFIDMTSHELRNPLSAVVQCADSVIASLDQMQLGQLRSQDETQISELQTEVQACIESVQTIVSCSLHSKRVIDDVLTLSKLDSNLILITPTVVQPAVVVTDALKMFDAECSQTNITLEFQEDESFEGKEWVLLDPSRLLQVLINLLTNAIKFTKDRPTKKISVTLGGSWNKPPKVWKEIAFTGGDEKTHDIVDKLEWGKGRKCYLWLKVTDTGCGMTEEEQKKLFSRFSQATPRTHIKYGGSGLGLFISKSLSALQGGSIGVHSEEGVGSTFAFFVFARLVDPPAGSAGTSSDKTRPRFDRTISAEDAMKKVKLNVLVVEDNLVNQKVLQKQLQRFGWNVSIAGNGEEAIEWLKKSIFWRTQDDSGVETDTKKVPDGSTSPATEKPDLDIILMDIEMPVMDGLTCARMIRNYEAQGLLRLPAPNRPATLDRQLSSSSVSPITTSHEPSGGPLSPVKRGPRLPILAVSANARMEQIEHALAAGMDGAISKPFRIPELWPKIKAMVKRVSDD